MSGSGKWKPIEGAPRDRTIELRGRTDTTKPKETTHKGKWNAELGVWATKGGWQICASAWREVTK